MKRPLIALLVTSAFLTACGKNDEQDPSNSPAQAPAQEQAQAPAQVAATTPRAASPRGDASKPLSEYRRINNGFDLMFLYYGLRKEPVNYEKIASVYSYEYDQTSDVFKKKDILNAIKQPVDEQIDAARKGRYIVWEIESNQFRTVLMNYDMASQSFRVNGLDQDASFYWMDRASSYRLAFTNADEMAALKVPDEAKAREIESLVSKNAPLVVKIYAFVTDAGANPHHSRVVNAEIMKIEVVTARGAAVYP